MDNNTIVRLYVTIPSMSLLSIPLIKERGIIYGQYREAS